MDCNQSPMNTPQRKYGRLPDIHDATALHNYFEKDDRKTLYPCMAFLQLSEVCSKRECNNIHHKLASNFTAIESFLKQFKTIDSIRQKLYEEVKMRALRFSSKKEVFICHNNVPSTLYCKDPLTVLRELVAQCSSHKFLHSSKTLE